MNSNKIPYTTRKLTLYRHKHGTTGYNNIEAQYKCFGDYDGLNISAPYPIDQSFLNLSTYTLPGKKIEDIDAHQQDFFLCRPQENKEKSFWEGGRVLTATFVKLNTTDIDREDMIGKFEEIDPNSIIAYYSFGGISDMIVFIKKDQYKDCDTLIRKLRYSCNLINFITYTYTTPAVSTSFYRHEITGFEEQLYKVSFSFAAKSHGDQSLQSLQHFINQINNKLSPTEEELKRNSSLALEKPSVTSILGDYDIRVVFMNVSFQKLLRLYDRDGLLNYQSTEYNQNIYHCATKIHTHIDDEMLPIPNNATKPYFDCFYDKNIETVNTWTDRADIRSEDKSIAKTMRSILLSLRQASVSRLGQEISAYLKPKIKLFIELMGKSLELDPCDPTKLKYPDCKLEPDDYISINAFLMRIYVTITTANIGSLDLIQSQSIGITLYNTPYSLIKFYANFANLIRDFLCSLDTKEEYKPYEFLFLTDIASQINTSALFPQAKGYLNEGSLLLATISDQDIFSGKLLMPLAHEACHYIGEAVRCRESRNQLARKTAINILCKSLLQAVKRYIPLNALQKIQDEIFGRIDKYISQLDENRGSAPHDHYGRYVESNLVENFFNYFQLGDYEDIVEYIGTEIWRRMNDGSRNFKDLFKTKVPTSEDKYVVLEGIISELAALRPAYIPLEYDGEIVISFNGDLEYINDYSFNMSDLISTFISYSREIQADIISLLMLNSEPLEYLNQFVELDRQALYTSTIQTRLNIVLLTLAKVDKSFYSKLTILSSNNHTTNPFTPPDTYQFTPDSSKEFSKFIQSVTGCDNGSSPEEKNQDWYLEDGTFKSYLSEYALICAQTYLEKTKGLTENDDQLNKIRLYSKRIVDSTNIIEAISRRYIPQIQSP